MSTSDGPIARVALPVPFRRCFDYLIPEPLRAQAHIGARARVPFGRRDCIGILWDRTTESELPRERLKSIHALVDETPLLDAPARRLLRWAATYYHHPLGEVIAAALPQSLRLGRSPREISAETVTDVDPQAGDVPVLTPAQQGAVTQILAARDHFQVFVLHGVTGSGKTEVYLEIAMDSLAKGRQILVLIPEIGMSPQTVRRFEQRLRHPVALYHSTLTDAERAHTWWRAKRGEAPIIIGTRSAVWLPLARPGAIIVDEEHDGSYKQQEGFRYSARDVAITRAQQEQIPVVLGSATPSLETLHNVSRGRYTRLSLPERATGVPMPVLRLVDLRQRSLAGGLSQPMIDAIARRLASQEQVLVFLNRRGYAPAVLCHECGRVLDCPRCDAHLTYHRESGCLCCHHCGSQRALPDHCGECGAAAAWVKAGQGTERLVESLRQRFHDAAIMRIDRDSTRRKGALAAAIEQAHTGQASILVGTQMLSKGHDFPRVTLVCVVDADGALYSADFRAAEHLMQLLLQVAGRAGRVRHQGEVMVQTHHPDHPLLQALLRQDYSAYGMQLLAERRETHLPPYSHLALLRAEAARMEAARQFLEQARGLLPPLPSSMQAHGPLPAPRPRRAGHHRAQLWLQAAHRQPLHRVLMQWLPALETLPAARRVRWSLDVDPQDMF
ncbi:MAG TPA: primosomal protein N' [Gammaproteobacteria bacterium]|nr:primosomal protein N' [Gammaproteobacteria bacterium]